MAMPTLDSTQTAMLAGLRSHLEAALRAQLQPVAKAVIDEAVKEAMSTFEASLRLYVDHLKLGPTVEVLLRDKRTPAA